MISVAGVIRGPLVSLKDGRPTHEGAKVLQAMETILNRFIFFAGDPTVGKGVIAPKASLLLRLDGGANTTLYIKTGTANTAWTAK